MRSLLLAVALVATTPAMAQHRVDARQLDCESVQALIDDNGAVVLTTGQFTYDRYVVDGRFCYSPDVARYTTIPSADTNQCPVYRCDQPLLDFYD
ncbi:hypothetical protein [Aliihoeflea sp. PC F10.4]